MTEQDKQLLFKDLCARLPYHVRVKVWLKDGSTEEGPLDLQHNYGDVLLDAFHYNKITKIRPYIRPMSSMTEEEKKELQNRNIVIAISTSGKVETGANGFDWLNAHHFDYRGLIPMCLALPATDGMYEF